MIYQFGAFELDTKLFELRQNGLPQRVEPQVFDLLCLLVECREQTMTKSAVLDGIWPGKTVSEATLSGRIKAARQAVGDNGREQNIIRTVHGRGFRFVAPVLIFEAADGKKPEPQKESSPAVIEDGVRPRIAVLPFENVGGSVDSEYFSDGITDEITLLLARNRGLQIVSRHSSFSFQDQATNVREIGNLLDARYLIAGRVRRAGNRLRVNVQLIQVSDGTQLWSENYDREVADVFALEDEIALKVASTLEPELTDAEGARVRRKAPENWTAWDFYQRGRWHLFKFTSEGIAEAERMFARAANIDPTLAQAYAGMAYVYIQEAFYGGASGRAATLEAAMQAARRAVAEDNRDPFCRFALGRAYSLHKRYEDAAAELKTALSLNPSYAHAHFALGFTYAFGGEPERAILEFERFEELSPRDPHCSLGNNIRATACLWLGQLKTARHHAERAVRHPHATHWAFATLASVLGHSGGLVPV
jgi:TolB-like protein/Flp pilus assembly protein TadD